MSEFEVTQVSLNPRVRSATVEDAPAIGDLWRESGLDQLPTVANLVTLVLKDEDGQLLAFCSFAVDGKRAVGVGVASRKAGAGSELMLEVFRISREMGCTWMISASREKNLAWHQRLGYAVVGYSQPYFADGEPAWIMAKGL